MTSFPQLTRPRFSGLLSIALFLFLLANCARGPDAQREYVWVSAPQVNLRDRVAAIYSRVATVRNGERLEVLERQKRFVRVRTTAGQEGWIEQRYLVGPDVYAGFQKLASDAESAPVQGHAVARVTLNMHITPARDSEHLYQLKDGEKLELIRRGMGDRPGVTPPTAIEAPASSGVPKRNSAPQASGIGAGAQPSSGSPKGSPGGAARAPVAPPVPSASKAGTEGGVSSGSPKGSPGGVARAPAAPPVPGGSRTTAEGQLSSGFQNKEDWWLARDAQRHVGWVLGRMIDLDVPLEIAQYAEGQRIVGAFVLNQVYDAAYEPSADQSGARTTAPSPDSTPAPTAPPHTPADPHRVGQYVVALNQPKDGLPYDYDQIRVFTWNLRRHHYETAYRDHSLVGMLPIITGETDFGGKEGKLPTFTLRLQDQDGQLVERKYKLNGPMVRRVATAGEHEPKMARPQRPRPKEGSKNKKPKRRR